MIKGLKHLSYEESPREWYTFSEKAQGEISVFQNLKGEQKEGASLFMVIPSERQGAQTEMLEFSSEHQVRLFHCVSDHGGGFSCLGDLQRSSGHRPDNQPEVALSQQGGWTRCTPEIASNLSHSKIL